MPEPLTSIPHHVDPVLDGSNIYDSPPNTRWMDEKGNLDGPRWIGQCVAWVRPVYPGEPTPEVVARAVEQYREVMGKPPTYITIPVVKRDEFDTAAYLKWILGRQQGPGPTQKEAETIGYNVIMDLGEG